MRTVPKVSGTVIRANRKAFGRLLGDDLVRGVFMDEPRYRFWEETTALEWAELGVVEESVCALARAAHRDPVALNMEATRIGTEDSFRTIWRVLLSFTSDDALVARSPLLYGRAFNVGRLAYEHVAQGHAILRVTDWRDPPPFHMHGLSAGIETMLRVAGRPDARVRYESEDGQTLFRAMSRHASR